VAWRALSTLGYASMVGKAIARFAAIGPIVPLVALWYLSATMAVTSSRSVLQATGLPFCLSAAQFTISSFLSRWVLQYGLPWFTGGVYKPMLRDLSLDRPERKFVRSIALTYTLGFVFTNISLALCNASFSETVKSAEPISSLALAAMTRGEDSVTTLEWLTTLPIVLGVALSSYGDASFHAFGFFAAFASNFMFSMRGLNTKQLRCVQSVSSLLLVLNASRLCSEIKQNLPYVARFCSDFPRRVFYCATSGDCTALHTVWTTCTCFTTFPSSARP